jgi:hypothetical protein
MGATAHAAKLTLLLLLLLLPSVELCAPLLDIANSITCFYFSISPHYSCMQNSAGCSSAAVYAGCWGGGMIPTEDTNKVTE